MRRAKRNSGFLHTRATDSHKRYSRTLTALTLFLMSCAITGRVHAAADSQNESTPVFHVEQRSAEAVLKADKPWESHCVSGATVIREGSLWRMWYGAYDGQYKRDDDSSLCYAESNDGVHWSKPDLGIVEYHGNKNNNLLLYGRQIGGFAFSCVFIDESKDANEKYKMIWQKLNEEKQAWWVYGAVSADGKKWTLLPEPISPKNSDTTTACIPDGDKYRLYTRVWQGGDFKGARAVGYTESDHFGSFPDPIEIFSHDAQDPAELQFYSNAATKLADRLYVMLPAAFYTQQQKVESHLAWSRDGIHFTRQGREPIVGIGTTFDSKGVYVMPGVVQGDKPNSWWMYYTGTSLEHDIDPKEVKYDGGIGRFLLVLD
ncbi:MAG: hypothetical protein K1Y02_00265 [Candidatus Hydrogenedentes bacterium]|nr:hypothetical protein [Candidatus Hydrogenedentota bacterium]